MEKHNLPVIPDLKVSADAAVQIDPPISYGRPWMPAHSLEPIDFVIICFSCCTMHGAPSALYIYIYVPPVVGLVPPGERGDLFMGLGLRIFVPPAPG